MADGQAAYVPAVTLIDLRNWISLHLYSEQGLRTILLNVVQPTVEALLGERCVDRFFFIRYWDEGGEHVRLRLRLLQVDGEGCLERITRAGLNMCRVEPVYFEPESKRYGGEGVLASSLDFFTISSAHAFLFETKFGDRPGARKLTLQMCMLLWQAWGFARRVSEFFSLLGYFNIWADRGQKVIALADEFFAKNSTVLLDLIEGELWGLAKTGWMSSVTLGSAGSLSRASRALSHALSGIDCEARWSTGASQMHMTANRLGMTNVEESYCSRLLVRTVCALVEGRPEVWKQVSRTLDRVEEDSREEISLEDLTQLHLGALLRSTQLAAKTSIAEFRS